MTMRRMTGVMFGALLACLALLCAATGRAYADPTSVVYEGDAKSFVFLPESTDLFRGFKEVMPGDELTQEITVENGSNDVEARIYLRAETIDERHEGMLSQMHLTVEQDGSAKLFEAPASEQGGLRDWVCLGTLQPGGRADLRAVLKVPVEAGNELQGAYGEVVWTFMVEELPSAQDGGGILGMPRTGDEWADVLVWGAAAIVSALVALIAWKRCRSSCGKKRQL